MQNRHSASPQQGPTRDTSCPTPRVRVGERGREGRGAERQGRPVLGPQSNAFVPCQWFSVSAAHQHHPGAKDAADQEEFDCPAQPRGPTAATHPDPAGHMLGVSRLS